MNIVSTFHFRNPKPNIYIQQKRYAINSPTTKALVFGSNGKRFIILRNSYKVYVDIYISYVNWNIVLSGKI